MARNPSTKVEISFVGKKLKVDRVNIRSDQLTAELKSKRNDIARYVSDFISENIGLGRKVSPQEAKLFGNERAAPDGAVDINVFNALLAQTGTKTRITKTSQPGAEDTLAFFETKIAGLGDSGAIQFTSTTISKDSELQKMVVASREKIENTDIVREEITGTKAIELLFTPEFVQIKNSIMRNTREKLENLLVINTSDKDRTPGITYSFVPSPINANTFTSIAEFSKFFDIRIKPRTYGTTNTAYRVFISSTPALQAEMDSKTVDITKQVQSLQGKAMSSRLLKYLKDRIQGKGGSRTSQQDINEYLALAYSIAKDFRAGGHTPFTVETKIKTPGSFSSSSNLRLTGKAKVAKTVNVPKPQKFMSQAQWTSLVQKRLGDSMLSFGEPEPPDIKERSGRFRRSVKIIPNYKIGALSYEYHPDYRSLEHYGYHPELQVERAIRQVAQEHYIRSFSITRRGSIV